MTIDCAALRDRLLGLRAALQLAKVDHLDAGLLATLAHVEIVLAALSRDAEPLPV
jgi:hypothetical protein